jgi:hypothetical protein
MMAAPEAASIDSIDVMLRKMEWQVLALFALISVQLAI